MRRAALQLGTLLFAACGPLCAKAPDKIARLSFRGNVAVATQALQAVLTQKVGDPFSQGAAEKDRRAVKNMGDFDGEIGLAVTPDPAGGEDVVYAVKENPIVRRIIFTANTPTKIPDIPPAVLLAQMTTRTGELLNTNSLIRDLDHLFNRQDGYARQQGFLIDASRDMSIDSKTGTLTLPLLEAHVDFVMIVGNLKTPTERLTRLMRIKPGDVVNENVIQQDLTRLQGTGLFSQVGPYTMTPSATGKVVITVPVVERS